MTNSVNPSSNSSLNNSTVLRSPVGSLVGVILAGGLAKRMGGGDKCLLPLAGKTLLQRTIERAQPQIPQLILNANGNSLRFTRSGLPVVADKFDTNLGPLAGIHAAMHWIKENAPRKEWLISIPSDTPFFPTNLVLQLMNLRHNHSIVVAKYNQQLQPVFGLWSLSLFEQINEQLSSGTVPRLQDWITNFNPGIVEFPAQSFDPFFNVNTPQDLFAAEQIATQLDTTT